MPKVSGIKQKQGKNDPPTPPKKPQPPSPTFQHSSQPLSIPSFLLSIHSRKQPPSPKMCKFNYHRYDECGHRVIKLDHFCAPKFWMSGIKGALVSCEEKLYTSLAVMNDVVFVGRWRWYGMKGWCLNCEREFLVSFIGFSISYDGGGG